MAKQTINQGTAPTGAGGDTFRSGSAKLQANDDELYTQLGATAQGVLPAALPVNKGGTGATTAAAARTNLGLGTAASATLTVSTNDPYAGRVLRVGDYGVGGTGVPVEDTPSAGRGGFYMLPAAADKPVGMRSVDRSFISVPRDLPGYHTTVHFPYLGGGGCVIRTHHPTSGVTDILVRTSGNTTVDANGFIKNASPIVKLFADRIELNDEAQQQDISFEKLGTGDYLIKDSSGFAQEGWYIETPKDANGNVLVAVVYEQLANGDISVKTYDYMLNKKGRIVADTETPLDIPETRWIDLRLQELPQPEIEIPESITPPEFQPTGLAQAVATAMESYHDPEQ